jgi:hypothetical protein
MIHLKSFINFINEGAWYEENGENVKVFVSLKNDPNNPNELLKTPYLNGDNFNKVGMGGIKVYYGLHPKTPYSGVRGANGDPASQRAKGYIMDNLKDSNPDIFSMATGETLEGFIQGTAIKSKNINYIVTVGSSQGLVKTMRDSLLNLYPEANVIDLTKIDYFNADDAIDKEALERAIQREMEIPRFDSDKNPIDRFSTTAPLVEDWAKRIAKSLRERIEGGEENPSFNIKSTGIKGSVRSLLRPKYNTAKEEFVDAVVDCVFGNENGDTGKMLIIDDNTQHFVDFANISNKIIEILAGIIDITSNKTQEALLSSNLFDNIIDNYKKRNAIRKAEADIDNIIPDINDESIKKRIENNIIGYVLYTFNSQISHETYTLTAKQRLEIGARVFALINQVKMQIPKYRYIDAAQPFAIKSIAKEKGIGSEEQIKDMYKEYLVKNKILNNINWTRI